jgi:hypothetical protein
MFRFINEDRTNILINSLNELLNNYRVRNNSFNLSLLNDTSRNIYSSMLDTETSATDTYSTDTYSTDTYSTLYPSEDYIFFNNFLNNQRNNILYDELENSIVNRLEFSEKKYKKIISDNGKKELKKIQYKKNDDKKNDDKKNDDKYKNNICPIIQTEFDDNEIITQLPCKHCFNTEAITHWLEKEKAECPICRFELDYDEIKIEDQDQDQDQDQLNVIPVNYNMDIDRYMEQLTGVEPDNNLIDSLITSRTSLFQSFTRTYSDLLTILMNNENQDADFQEALLASLN